jgi:D-alanine--poly(phosphoribitol) ligase subunit 1
MNLNFALPFYEHARLRPDSIALYVSGKSYSYGELAVLVGSAAAVLGNSRTVAVLASRSLGAYVGILAAGWAGAAYIPLNPKLPEQRLSTILEIVRPDALVVDEAGLARLTPSLRAIAPPLILDLSDKQKARTEAGISTPVSRGGEDLAYIIFTSGTTGVPKGVMISLGSLAQFLEAMRPRVCPVASDRVSQTSELSFDVSVFEMFLSWSSGASVHVVPGSQLMAPFRFIVDQKLTIWSSVPSIAAFMHGRKMLRPGVFPSLRYSVFAGEALPYPLAESWRVATPSGVVENLYGPTEATIYCLGATVSSDFPPTPGRNLVPSGSPLPGVEAAILGESLKFVPRGQEGQLAIAGGQLAKGYYNEPELTCQRFPSIDGKRWYLTGDLARQDERGVFHHLGRMDHQVKILGQRVELDEIEAHLRSISGSENVAAVAWPVRDGVVSGVVAFTGGVSTSPEKLLESLRLQVPSYMVPRQIVQMDALPLSPNGKIDRRALVRYLDKSQAGSQ